MKPVSVLKYGVVNYVYGFVKEPVIYNLSDRALRVREKFLYFFTLAFSLLIHRPIFTVFLTFKR